MDRKYHQIRKYRDGKHTEPYILEFVTIKDGTRTIEKVASFATHKEAKDAMLAAKKGPTSPAPEKAKAKPRKKKA